MSLPLHRRVSASIDESTPPRDGSPSCRSPLFFQRWVGNWHVVLCSLFNESHISVPCLPSAVPGLTPLFLVYCPLSPVSQLCSLSAVLCSLSHMVCSLSSILLSLSPYPYQLSQFPLFCGSIPVLLSLGPLFPSSVPPSLSSQPVLHSLFLKNFSFDSASREIVSW